MDRDDPREGIRVQPASRAAFAHLFSEPVRHLREMRIAPVKGRGDVGLAVPPTVRFHGDLPQKSGWDLNLERGKHAVPSAPAPLPGGNDGDLPCVARLFSFLPSIHFMTLTGRGHRVSGGIAMLMGIEALAEDDSTKVIVVVSKPPAPEVAKKVLDALGAAGKPSVVHFIGLDPMASGSLPASIGSAGSLEGAAQAAVKLATGRAATEGSDDERAFEAIAEREANDGSSDYRACRVLRRSPGGGSAQRADGRAQLNARERLRRCLALAQRGGESDRSP